MHTESRRESPRGIGLAISVLSLGTLAVLVLAPLTVVFVEAFSEGLVSYASAVSDRHTLAALGLTLFVIAIVVPINAVFGIAAAWLMTRQSIPLKSALAVMLDIPFTVSPIVSGLLFVLLFGARGWLGGWLEANDIQIIYAVPGIVLATLFVTLPFVARELIPAMEAQGNDEEEAAASLGASFWQILWRVTLPRVRWALFYGCVLATARAAGEFGAVSVVSGHVRGETNTLPLHVEILWNEYRSAEAFAVATILSGIAMLTIGLRFWLERARSSPAREKHDRAELAGAGDARAAKGDLG